MKRWSKLLSIVLAGAMVAGSLEIPTATVKASDTLPYLGESARGANQAYEHGYRSLDIADWSPETDPYADQMRACVPLQKRNAALAATQANPSINAATQMAAIAGDYGNSFFDSYPYTNEFSQYLFNFWQYTDIYGSWHGMPTQDVPESLYQDERGVNDAWKNREFEFGVVNMPNPGYTNAAHKNGVLSIGCIFCPRTGQKSDPLLEKDAKGKFIAAAKLTEMCRYYGFDGYFINQEETIPKKNVQPYREFMKQMRDDGIYIQWYDSIVSSGGVAYQNEFNSKNSCNVISDDKTTQYADSIFLNYWWNRSKLKDSAAHAVSLNLDPLKVVFAGLEAGGNRWYQPYDLDNNLNDSGNPMNAIATLGSEFVHDGLDEDLDGTNDNVAMRREKDEYQWMTFKRERAWWSGPDIDPSTVSKDEAYTDKAVGIDIVNNSWHIYHKDISTYAALSKAS